MSRRSAADHSLRARASGLLGIGAVLASVAIVTATPATADASDPTSPGVHYAIVDRACSETAPGGEATCFAEQRVPVPAGTDGAEPFTIGPGYETGPKGGYTPGDLLTAYGLTGLSPTAGTGQTVAVVDAYDDPNALSDLNFFDAHYGLPAETASTFAKLNQSGAASPLPSADTKGWSEEESLDVDAVRAICHNCKILLIETNSNSNVNLQAGVAAAVAAGANEVSNSYGGAETGATSSPYNYPGVVITASTGDNGWYGWDNYDSGTASDGVPEAPASLPNVVAVGGTSLTLNADATRNTEAVWNEDGPEDSQFIAHNDSGASGGGCSKTFTAQAWQSHIAGFSNTGCGTNRLAADVSALADPYTGFDVYDTDHYTATAPNGWATFGGTSLASPLVAAMWALAGGAQGVAYPSLTLYGHANAASPPFYDVTKGYVTHGGVSATGGNDWCDGDVAATCKTVTGTEKGNTNPNGLGKGMLACALDSSGNAVAASSQCTATVGFDGPSGVGTPTGLTDFAPMKPSPSYTAPTGVHTGVSTAFSGSATDPFPGGTISSYSWSWGDGTTASSGASTSHTFSAAGNYNVTLTTTDNYNQVGTVSHNVSVGTPPTVTAVSPSSGPAAGGTSVTITGTGFTGATAVNFGSVVASTLTVNSATQITATAPASAAGTVDVSVTTPGGTSATVASDHFTYVAAPVVTSVSPSTGPTAGGTSVTITGTGFTGATAVTFGATAASTLTVDSLTQITATSPASAAGAVDVTVTTPGGQSSAGVADLFTFTLSAPVVTAVAPSSGSASGGTSVTITGTGFTGATKVEFGNGSSADGYTVQSDTTITATSPPHAGGKVNIRVTTAQGKSAAGPGSAFTFDAPPPVVTDVAPKTGSTAGGTSVTISGSGFTGATAVSFGSSFPATSFSVDSDGQITAVAPAHSKGSTNVRVTTGVGQSDVVPADQFTYKVPAPVVTGVSPSSGSIAGGTHVTITGTGFTGATAVAFSGAFPATNVTVVSDSKITADSPAHTAGIVHIRVTTAGGQSAAGAADQFTYNVSAPVVTGVSPSSGATEGGTHVTIIGTGFTGATSVKFGTGLAAASFTVVSDTEIDAVTPPHAAGTVGIQVHNSAGTSDTNPADRFTYV